MNDYIIITITIASSLIFLGCTSFFLKKIFSPWLQCKISNAKISIFQLIGMWLRRVPLETIVEAYIYSCKAGIPIDIKTLEAHCLAGGNVLNVVHALIYAKDSLIKLDFKQAATMDLAGGNVLEIIKGYQDKKLREFLEDLKNP